MSLLRPATFVDRPHSRSDRADAATYQTSPRGISERPKMSI
jgi:hypothetical protein